MKNLLFLLLTIISSFSYCQTDSSYTLKGTVVDVNTNKPLPGAHIISSKNLGTKTNLQGNFTLSTTKNDTLTISFIGYKSAKYICKDKPKGEYLTKLKLAKDSVILDEIIVFPYPNYKEFKKAFIALNKEDEKIKIRGVKTYVDVSNSPQKPSVLNPASYIYDRLFDKQAKLKRRLDRHRKTIKNAKNEDN
ncbi:MAG: carboxypeptidase-like regulatory domain-containing protein [Vicingaceae bacterium]